MGLDDGPRVVIVHALEIAATVPVGELGGRACRCGGTELALD